jgi:hypothetical protein
MWLCLFKTVIRLTIQCHVKQTLELLDGLSKAEVQRNSGNNNQAYVAAI